MKKLSLITILVSIFITSNAMAVITCADCAQDLTLPSKVYAGFGTSVVHDKAPDWHSENFYELKFDTPIQCADCAQ